MSIDYAQRRRVAVAMAITVIAAPAAFLLDRGGDDDTAADPAAANGTVVVGSTSPPPVDDPAPDATDPMGSAPVAFLEGTAPPPDAEGATIAIPRPQVAVRGEATFARSLTAVTECLAAAGDIPFDRTITVTNLDNSRSVQCISVAGAFDQAIDVVLHPDAYLQIADLTDAPIPVQITW